MNSYNFHDLSTDELKALVDEMQEELRERRHYEASVYFADAISSLTLLAEIYPYIFVENDNGDMVSITDMINMTNWNFPNYD